MPRVLNLRYLTDGIPVGAVLCDRSTDFGSPFPISHERDGRTRAESVECYRSWIHDPEQAELRARMRRELAGKDLVCHCAPAACHCDVVLEVANSPEPCDNMAA